jgi:hypothetical protein
MKRIFLLSIFFLACFAGNALAQACAGTRLNSGLINGKFINKLLCAARPNATTNLDRWAEEHLNASQLFEHAKGSSDPIDPRRLAGTWGTVNNCSGAFDCIRYDYGTGGIYTWGVWEENVSGGPGQPLLIYNFCTPGNETKIASGTLQSLPAASVASPCGY